MTEAVLAFDGRHVDALKVAVQSMSPEEYDEVTDLCSSPDPRHRIAATWVVKALMETERGGALDLRKVFSCLATENEPDALLHLLQCVQHEPGPASEQVRAVRNLLDHGKTLVAVWAMDAFVRIALETGNEREAARHLVRAALGDNTASKRARARHLSPLLGL